MPQTRRFKKRHAAAAVALLAAALFGWAVWQAATAAPNPTTDFAALRLALIAEAQPPGEDQWPLVQETLNRADAILGAAGNPDLTPLYSAGQFDPEYWAEARADALGAFEEVRSAGLFDVTAALPPIRRALRPRQAWPLTGGPLPYQHQGRKLLRAQMARLRLAWNTDEWEEVVAAVEESFAIARLIAAQGTLIDYLVGVAIHEMPLFVVREQLVRHPIDDADVLDALLAAIDRQTPITPPSIAYEDERLLMLAMVEQVYTDDGAGDGRLVLSEAAKKVELPTALSSMPIANIAAVAFPSRAETVATINKLMDEVVTQASAMRYERKITFDPETYIQQLPRNQVVVHSMTPPTGIFIRDMADTHLAAVRLLLRIERFRLQGGAPPETLAVLTAADSEADITDPMTGAPFRYHVLTDDPFGRPYLLYSVGADLEDNGGAIYPNGNNLALNQTGAGYDFVVNAPPEPDEWDKP